VNTESIPEIIDGEDLRRICFTIEEGARSIVTDLKVIGNQSIAEDEIRKQIITDTQGLLTTGEFNKQVLDDDIQGVITLYLRKGYPDVKVDEEIVWIKKQDHKEKYADIRLRIHEGQKILISSITFKGLSGLSEELAMKMLVMKPGDPYRDYMLENDRNKLSMYISEMGYPHVNIQGKKVINRQKGKAHITYEISQGIHVNTGKVLTVGNFRTRKQVVEKEFALEEGKPFSMMKMIEGQRNIQNINAFKTARVKPIGLKEAAEEVDFLVEVEEKKPYAAQASMGYDTSRQLYLKTRLSDLNLFGLNKEAWIGLEISQIGNHGELGIAEPHLLDTRISAVTNLFWEKREELNKSFGTESYGSNVSFTRKLPHDLSANLVVGYERKEQYLRDGESLSESDEEVYDPRGIMVTSPSLVYNSVDSFIRPRKGVFSSIGVDFSRGLENSLDNFIKYRYEVRLYFQIHERIILATRGRAGYIVPSGEKSVIPEDQLFFLGGLSSVRGYDENRLRVDQTGDALGGRTEIVGSIESRFDIGFNLELSPFFDIGSVRNSLIDEGSDSFQSSIGVSLRYLTPYCPIGIQYGHKLDKMETDEEKGRFYFTIGYTF
ncbi:MAG: outer membrane protein assembly factor BamA, partial [Desulfobacterium sp.]|nr:outer membrane protein assembly factor BamA [Desulfobacterium sp.]